MQSVGASEERCPQKEMGGMSQKLNFLVVVADTFRRDHLGAYGNENIRTPHLDALSRESIVFDNYRIGSFPTMPARADLLTGQFAFTFMAWEPLSSEPPTLPAVFSTAGYATMAVVDTPFFVRNGFGFDRGFDDFEWIRGQGDDLRPAERQDARATWKSEADRFAPRTMATAEAWLERHYEEPFFLYVDTWDPHEPWDAPLYYTRLYAPDYAGQDVYPCYGPWERAGLTIDDVELGHAAYCGEITMVDRAIGGLLEKLDVLGIADTTAVVFLSDHGFYFGEHGYFGKADLGFGPGADIAEDAWLAEVRRSPLYQEITRVPLMFRIPGLEASRREGLATAADIAPTLLDLAGLKVPGAMKGRSLTHILAGTDGAHRDLVVSSWPLKFLSGSTSIAIDSRPRRVGVDMPLTVSTLEWSLVVGGPTESPELYNVVDGKPETINVWSDRRDEGIALLVEALDFLATCGTADEWLKPRQEAALVLGSA
jgi:arylsulfatase A-like enzyme